MSLDDPARRELLKQLTGLGRDADHHLDRLRVFLPLPSHRLALEPRTLVVRGERGAGKTALFQALHALAQRGIPPTSVFNNQLSGDWVEGFSEVGTEHPATDVLDQWGLDVNDPAYFRAFWLGHLVAQLSNRRPDLHLPPALQELWRTHHRDPAAWVPQARQSVAALTSWLDRFEAEGHATTFVTYDHLDKIGVTRPVLRQDFASALLGLWLSLSNRFSRIRGKVFLREDLFQGALHGSADASKLEARSASLHWSAEDLYRMFLRHLGASDALRKWLEEGESDVIYTKDPILGFLPPEVLPEESGFSQRRLAERLIGPQMGEGVKKGYTHRWIVNHLQDAHGAIVPRSMLNLFAFAAREALMRGPQGQLNRLLHHTELQAALEQTSSHRVQELVEEHRVVQRIRALRGQTFLAERTEVVRRLAEPGPQPDGFERDGEQVFIELERLGVLKTREDGRVDIPDIYRSGFGIKRRGGTARSRIPPIDSPNALTTLQNRAFAPQSEGHLPEVQASFEEPLGAPQGVPVPKLSDIPSTFHNLAAIPEASAELHEARARYEQALEALRRILGPEHPDTLRTLQSLADTIKAQGDLKWAQSLEEQALEARSRVLGPEHPDTLATLQTLALTLQAQGALKEAQALQERALRARSRVLGPECRRPPYVDHQNASWATI